MQPRQTPMSTLFSDHVDTLGVGAIGFHAQLHPGVYPPDTARHTATLEAGEDRSGFATDSHWDRIRRITGENGATIARLVVLPTIGTGRFVEPGGGVRAYTRSDLELMLNTARVADDAGEDVRVIPFHAVERQLRTVRPRSDLFASLEEGIDTGNPQASFWSFRAADTDDPHAVAIMNYEGGELPHADLYAVSEEPGQSRMPLAVAYYELYWWDAFATATPVGEAASNDFVLPTALPTPVAAATRTAAAMRSVAAANVTGRQPRQ